MDWKAVAFFESMQGKRIAFCGIGVSNTPLIKQFLQYGAQVIACDAHERTDFAGIAEELEASGATLKLGKDYLEDLDVDIIFRTPGMRFYLPELNAYRQRGVVITSEMEVFFELCPAQIFAVTGSDGKTTTTTLIAEMLKAQGFRVHLGGNIGKPLLPIIEEILPEDKVVVELSSFQLISMRCSPDVAVVTNVAPNHLDMHKDMQEYVDAKKNILWHQGAFSRSVLNLDNAITREMGDLVRGEQLWFSRKEAPRRGTYIDPSEQIYFCDEGEQYPVMRRDDIKLWGNHNVENYLAAITALWGYVTPENMARVAREFSGVEHRMELVREVAGVRWYNDSIATNPTRTMAGLDAMQQKILLIAGGYDKKIPFEPLAPMLVKKVKTLILMGKTGPQIENVVRKHKEFATSGMRILYAKDMEDAVRLAKVAAEPGDIVSLSPASASFDAYKNFEVRGKHYKSLVMALEEGEKPWS